jgi:uncharacterized protein (DUF697 family)
MTTETRRILRRYRIASAVTSVVTHPVPLVDELFVIPIHYAFVVRLARARGVKVRDVPWRQVQQLIWGGAGVRFGFDLAFGVVPVAGAIAHAITASALTQVLGEYLDEALDKPSSPPPVTVQGIKQSLLRRLPRWAGFRVDGKGP